MFRMGVRTGFELSVSFTHRGADRLGAGQLHHREVYAKALKNMSPVIAWSVSSNLWMGAR
jgi:hypothetical protein